MGVVVAGSDPADHRRARRDECACQALARRNSRGVNVNKSSDDRSRSNFRGAVRCRRSAPLRYVLKVRQYPPRRILRRGLGVRLSTTLVARRPIRGSIMVESNGDISGTLPSTPVSRAAMSRAEAAAIDAGLRTHMAHIYNYMALGLAVTAIAAMGVYILSVTDDPAAAAKIVRSGTVNPARLAGSLYLTSTGYTLFVSPLKWAIILAPLALAFGLSFGIERMRPAVAQLLFWLYAALIGISLGSVFMIYTQTSVG